ncbi:MAG: enoyl-CoA hydratase-related protein [Mycobacteriales bacterium]
MPDEALVEYDDVTLRRVGKLAVLTLDRPAARNAISTAVAISLAQACAEVAADQWTRAVVFASSSPVAFCAGADLKERAEFSDEELLAQRPTMQAAFAALLALPQPVVAAVAGPALGGGLELALSCDLIVADTTAILGLPEVTVGLIPGGGGTQLLARRVGHGRAAELIFTGRRVDSVEAERIGLVDRVVPAGGALDAATELAGQIAANSPVGVRAAKRAMRSPELFEGLDLEDRAWRLVAVSADRREGISAFVEKRAPQWPEPLS